MRKYYERIDPLIDRPRIDLTQIIEILFEIVSLIYNGKYISDCKLSVSNICIVYMWPQPLPYKMSLKRVGCMPLSLRIIWNFLKDNIVSLMKHLMNYRFADW